MVAIKPPEQRVTRHKPVVEFADLPTGGRSGPPPRWPLSTPSAAERKRWAVLWAKPQAVMWEQLGSAEAVARYCRAVLIAESSMEPKELALVLTMENSLGLTPAAMMRLHWRIKPAESGTSVVPLRAVADIRKRIKAVED